jgi:hypothetical protein
MVTSALSIMVCFQFLVYANHNFNGVDILFGNGIAEYRLALHGIRLWPVARQKQAQT